MSQLHWQEKPEKNAHISSSGETNVWFGLSMTLMGMIAGFILVTFVR